MSGAESKRLRTTHAVSHTKQAAKSDARVSKNPKHRPDEDFDRLLGYFDSDPIAAARRYQSLRQRVVFFFDRRGCNDPEYQADETFSRAARWKGPEPINSIISLVFSVASTQMLEVLRSRKREPVSIEEISEIQGLRSSNPIEFESSAERVLHELKMQCLDSCLEEMEQKDRLLLINWYRERGKQKSSLRKVLAAQLGIRKEALQTRLCRTRAKLLDCCQKCMTEHYEF